jgi:hypothetical protein
MSIRQTAAAIVVMLFSLVSVAGQSNDIAPGENLVLDGVPKIPTSVADAVGRSTHNCFGSKQELPLFLR